MHDIQAVSFSVLIIVYFAIDDKWLYTWLHSTEWESLTLMACVDAADAILVEAMWMQCVDEERDGRIKHEENGRMQTKMAAQENSAIRTALSSRRLLLSNDIQTNGELSNNSSRISRATN